MTSFSSRFLKLLTLLLIPAFFTSCTDESGVDGPVEIQLWDIATYLGYSNETGQSSFSFRQVDDSPEVNLTSTVMLPEEIIAGTRMVLRYIPESGKAYTSGPIRLLGASRINQEPVETEWKDEFNDWNRDKVFLYSTWRSGNYLNFHVRLTYDTEPRIFTLAADPATISSEWPDVYLVHVMATPTDYHDRAYFASFDISEIWANPTVKGIRLHVANTNLDKHEFTFVKNI